MGILQGLLQAIREGKFIDSTLDFMHYAMENPLNNEDIDQLCDALKKNKHIKNLVLHHQSIGDQGAKALASLNSLEELDLSNGLAGYVDYANHISAEGALELARSGLKKINLSCNSIGDKGLEHLSTSSKLVELDVSGCSITDVGAAHFFATNSTVKRLNLESNFLGDGAAMIALGTNKALEFLNLTACSITSEGATLISDNTNLKELILADNFIQDAGAHALAKNSSIEVLNLMQNQIADDGALAFAAVTALKILKLSDNPISSETKKKLHQQLPEVDLDLSYNTEETDIASSVYVASENPSLLLSHKRSSEQLFIDNNAYTITDDFFSKDNLECLQQSTPKKHRYF